MLSKEIYSLLMYNTLLSVGMQCREPRPGYRKTDLNPAFVTATLFSDVDFWEVPDWSLDAGTLSAEISEQTGLMLETIIPPQDADRALSLLLLKMNCRISWRLPMRLPYSS